MKVFRVGRRRRRVVLVAGVIAAVLLGLSLPASAHSGSISGSTVCYNGDHIVTWHITNSSETTTLLMTIVSVEAHRRRHVVSGDRLHLAAGEGRLD